MVEILGAALVSFALFALVDVVETVIREWRSGNRAR